MDDSLLTAVILTKNNQRTIEQCLKSLIFCNQILIIDDNSTDATLQIAKSYQAKILSHNLDNDFAQQRNYALKQVLTTWTLFIDADEVVSSELASEIKSTIDNSSEHGFYLRRKDYFINKILKHGDSKSFHAVRLAKTQAGQWAGKVHETWQINNVNETLTHPIIHYPHETTYQMIQKINLYSTIRAQELFTQNNKSSKFSILIYPIAKFTQNYFFRQGFRDGSHGIVHAIIMSFYSFLVRSKLYLLSRNDNH